MSNLDLKEILGSSRVVLQDMLDAREKRAWEQQRIAHDYKGTLISFTLNIPGSIKFFSLAEKTFEEGKKLIFDQLKKHKVNIAYWKENKSKTGCEAFYIVDGDVFFIKKLMVEIENSCMLGRIFDIDVLDNELRGISRKDIGHDGRTCLLCSEFSHLCSRNKTHTIEEVIYKTVEIMYDYFKQ